MAEETTKTATKASKASSSLKKLAEQLVGLSVLEANDLSEILKNDYGLEPAAAGVVAAPAAGGGEADDEAEAKSEFDVILKDIGGSKVAVIKAIKDLTGIGLGEAKTMAESAPKAVKTAVSKDEADQMKAKLEEAGATVELA